MGSFSSWPGSCALSPNSRIVRINADSISAEIVLRLSQLRLLNIVSSRLIVILLNNLCRQIILISAPSKTQSFKILSALSEPNRLQIVAVLNFRPLAVCEIREILGLSFSTVSRHLSQLQEAGLVDFDKERKWVIYQINPELAPELKELLRHLLALISNDTRIREDLKMAKTVDKNIICKINAVSTQRKLINGGIDHEKSNLNLYLQLCLP